MICNIKPSECIIALVMPLLHPLILEYLDVRLSNAPVIWIGCMNFQKMNVVYCTNDKNIHVTTF